MRSFGLRDVLGPIMVGPSSSHTAGALRIAQMVRELLDAPPAEVRFTLYGSFARTYQGHGTDRALVAGLLGMQPDDERIARSFFVAADKGMDFRFENANLRGEHPNTARLSLTGRSGRQMSLVASSLGGGRITVVELDGLRVRFSGDLPTLIVQNRDQPGHVSDVASMLASNGVNIATLQLYRDHPGGNAVMVIEIDKAVPQAGIDWLKRVEGINGVTFLNVEEDADGD